MSDMVSAAEAERVFGDDVHGGEGEVATAPVTLAERISSLDFIRGLAVMGILAANIVAFGQPPNAYMFPDAWVGSAGDPGGWMWIAQFILVDGKMRGLFTLLFGAGLYLFIRTRTKGRTDIENPRSNVFTAFAEWAAARVSPASRRRRCSTSCRSRTSSTSDSSS